MHLPLSLETLEDRTVPSGLGGINSSTPIPIVPLPDSRPVLISSRGDLPPPTPPGGGAPADLTSTRAFRDEIYQRLPGSFSLEFAGHRLGLILSIGDVIQTLEGTGNRSGIPWAGEPEDLVSDFSPPGNSLHGEGHAAGQALRTPGVLLEIAGQFLPFTDGFLTDASWPLGQAGPGDGREEMALCARSLEAVFLAGWGDRVLAWGGTAPPGGPPLPPEAELGPAANKDLTILAAYLNVGRIGNPSHGDRPSVPDPPPGLGREPAEGGLTDFIVGSPDPGHNRGQGRRREEDGSTEQPSVRGHLCPPNPPWGGWGGTGAPAQAVPLTLPADGMTEGEE